MSNTNSESTTSKLPTHIAYQVRESKDKSKSYWTRIGAAWANADGKGFNIQLDGLMPLDGHITLRVASEKKA